MNDAIVVKAAVIVFMIISNKLLVSSIESSITDSNARLVRVRPLEDIAILTLFKHILLAKFALSKKKMLSDSFQESDFRVII